MTRLLLDGPSAVERLRADIAGARGVVFGRNVFQAEDPARFLKALGEVVHKGIEPGGAIG